MATSRIFNEPSGCESVIYSGGWHGKYVNLYQRSRDPQCQFSRRGRLWGRVELHLEPSRNLTGVSANGSDGSQGEYSNPYQHHSCAPLRQPGR